MKTSFRGFTLIELLVVIAIIGILAGIVLASLGGARASARDAERISDIRTFQKAAELYYLANGRYPISSVSCGGVWTSFDSTLYSPVTLCNSDAVTSSGKTLTQEMAPYVGKLSDPKRTSNTDSGYLYRGDGVNYCFMVYLTPENLGYFPASMQNQVVRRGVASVFLGVGTFATAGC